MVALGLFMAVVMVVLVPVIGVRVCPDLSGFVRLMGMIWRGLTGRVRVCRPAGNQHERQRRSAYQPIDFIKHTAPQKQSPRPTGAFDLERQRFFLGLIQNRPTGREGSMDQPRGGL
ncbi:hypothetical protein HNE_2371 [Hyphomonas neptunium ATCC 15444]|uniref:Uncharacterized protein n=1 Tax=Hyphomonas neptunium (strain ATCC 15444) TaxID=228405 RepID=Q0BZM7_HYPNA|nr:hypothetical protein HNE_2371 [Hyphomonas neptunium ATCC 15444]